MPTNKAAWIKSPAGNPLVIEEAPYTPARNDQITIKNAAVAINPADVKLQAEDRFGFKYPHVFGLDVAGEVVEVGDGVTDLKVGARVMASCPGMFSNTPAASGFQLYSTVPRITAVQIPDSMSYSDASVLPLCLATAAGGLYQSDYLGLTHPSLAPKPSGKAVLVWGGASAVGSCAIQLLKNSGYDVYTTASSRNAAYCKELGAKEVFDYNSADVNEQIVNALQGKEVAGFYDAISYPTTLQALGEIAQATDSKKFIVSVNPRAEPAAAPDVTIKGVFAPSIWSNEVGPAVFGKFLPEALKQGKVLPKPDAVVVGNGLEAIQSGIDKLKAGASASKYVVTL